MVYLPGDPEEEPQLVVTLQLHRLVGLKAKVTGYLQKTKHVLRDFKELYWKSNCIIRVRINWSFSVLYWLSSANTGNKISNCSDVLAVILFDRF